MNPVRGIGVRAKEMGKTILPYAPYAIGVCYLVVIAIFFSKMNWIYFVVSGVITIVTLFLSRPKNISLMVITVCLVLGNTFWQSYSSWSEQKTNEEVRRFACRKLTEANSRFFEILSWAIYRSSNGWLAKNEDDFFSERVATQLCNCLNLDKESPFYRTTWRIGLGEACKQYRETLNEVMRNYGAKLNPDLIKYINAVEQSPFLKRSESMMLLSNYMLQEYQIYCPPILGFGMADVQIIENFKNMGLFNQEVSKFAREMNVIQAKEWLKLLYPKDWLGIDRFDQVAYEKWEKEHPGKKVNLRGYLPCTS